MIGLSVFYILWYSILTNKLIVARAVKVDVSSPHKNAATTLQTSKLLHGVREWIFTVTDPRDVIDEISDSGNVIHSVTGLSITSVTLLWGLTRRFVQIPLLSDVLSPRNELERNIYYEYVNGYWRRSTASAYNICKREHMLNVDLVIPCVANEYIEVSEKEDENMLCNPKLDTIFIKSIIVNGVTAWLPENPYTRNHLFAVVYPNKTTVDALTMLTVDDDAEIVNISDFDIVNSRFHPVEKPNRERIVILHRIHNAWVTYMDESRPKFVVGDDSQGQTDGILAALRGSNDTNDVTETAGAPSASTMLGNNQISVDLGRMIADNTKYRKVGVSDRRGLGCGYLTRAPFTVGEAKFGDSIIFKNPQHPPFFLVRYITEATALYALSDIGDEIKLTRWVYDGEWKEATVNPDLWVPWTIDIDISKTVDQRFFNVRDKRTSGIGNVLYMPRDRLAIGKILDEHRVIRELTPPAPAHVEVETARSSCTVIITFNSDEGIKYATHKKVEGGRWRVEESNMPSPKRKRAKLTGS